MVPVIAVFALIAAVELAPQLRRRARRGVCAFLFLFAPALILALLQANEIELPSVMLLLGDALGTLGLNYR
jgi:hypothetical protein